MKYVLPFAAALLALVPLAAQAQVGVGTTTPDAKAALDIRATDKGLLIPRLTAAQRTAITAPPQGLMVYQTDGTASGGAQTGFWYYAGTPGGWVFIEPALGSGLTLPYSGTASTSSTAFAVSNTGAGQALSGTATGNGAAAVRGENANTTSGSGAGVLGLAVSGYGVRGVASGTNGYGVAGESADSRGVSGSSGSGPGLYGRSTTGSSLQAQKAGSDLGRIAELTNANAANDSTAAYISTNGDRPALRAVNTATSAQPAIRGVKQSASADGIGVEGVITTGATGNAAGVLGNDESGSGTSSGVLGLTEGGYGVRGIASANGGYGVSGSATNSYGVIGGSTSGTGVYGTTNSSNAGMAGVKGISTNSGGTGVLGTTVSGSGVRGDATGSSGYGVLGTAASTNGIGIAGSASGAATAIYGVATGTGRAGYFGQNNTSSSATAVEIVQNGTGRALDVSGGPVRMVELNSPTTGGANLLPIAYGRVSKTGTIINGSGNFTVNQPLPGLGLYDITITSPGNLNLTNAVCVVSCGIGTTTGLNDFSAAAANGGPNGLVEVEVRRLSNPANADEQGFNFVIYRP
ncbi:hypothetical protein [Hymenobacter ruricola]|uniref:Collagen-like protein n=1 Tax=Hymenobacter ruricola TaxID=2791023 RepID=A0ABS0HZY8_9BACT|nr:hypothetical protein [Hymenobacter ruricola]MBF9220261.1 hypothetical protein [Hymenobacter ruricola]